MSDERRPIVLFGTGHVAAVVRFILEQESAYRVVALTADAGGQAGPAAADLEVVPFESVAERFPPASHGMLVAVGYSRMNAVRQALCQRARAKGYELVSHVSPRASVWPDLRVGDNTIVMDGATLGPFVTIGEGCLLWPRVYVGHGSRVGDYCYLAANAAISGLSSVGSRCVLGPGCIVRDGVSVGEACVVGVGAVLITDLEAHSVVAAPLPRRLPGPSERLPDL
jgi:sugar O-acyltransferase (sialic acid O-acetyltransferase NeuD family)